MPPEGINSRGEILAGPDVAKEKGPAKDLMDVSELEEMVRKSEGRGPEPDWSKLELDMNFDKLDVEASVRGKETPLDINFDRLDAEASAGVREVPDELINGIEGTPKEWREKLRSLVDSAKERLVGTEETVKEKTKWYLSANEGLIRRVKDLDLEAEKIGWGEKHFRLLGEKYNKLSLRGKLVVGASLGFGAMAFSTVSVPAALGFTLALGVQRAAGMATMYLKLEKRELDKKVHDTLRAEDTFWKWGAREKAMGKALLYTIGMSAAVKEGVQLVSDSPWGESVHEWLRNHYPFGPTTTPSHHIEHGTIVRSEVHQIPPAVVANETGISAPEMPIVAAMHGHGYEYMAKRLWEQLQEKHLNPTEYPEGSDIRRLLEADQSSINSVVHQIASDPNHHFFNPDGSSVLIHSDAHMTIDADGQIHMSDSINGVKAPEGIPVTHISHSSEVAMHIESSAEHVPAVPETPQTPDSSTAPTVEATTPIVDLLSVPAQAFPAPFPQAMEIPNIPHDVVNKFHELISMDNAHVYTSPKGETLVYGGTLEMQNDAIKQYFTAHPNDTVYGTDVTRSHRVPFRLVNGKLIADKWVKKKGLFSIFSRWMSAPDTNDLKKLIQ